MNNQINQKRRMLLAASTATALSSSHVSAWATRFENAANPWQKADTIIERCRRPRHFPQHDFVVTDFGAQPCQLTTAMAWVSFVEKKECTTPVAGAFDCYGAIRQAIETCHAAGGGRVVIPKGDWYIEGPIVLLSNVHVHLQSGAHVYFSQQPEHYARYGEFDCGDNGKLTLMRWEGNDCLNYSPLIYARGQRNIALTGDDWTSILDGQAGVSFPGSEYCWWSWKGRSKPGSLSDGATGNGQWVQHDPAQTENTINPLNPHSLREVAPHLSEEEALFIQGESELWRRDANYLRALAEARVPAEKRIFGRGHFLRPHMVQFISCTNVLFQGYQVTHSPFWQHNPVDCRNVYVKKIYANSVGPNNDGFDPESCNGVLIEESQFDTGDDCIAIDSGKGPDIQFGPSENIVIQHCHMHSGHGAITLGSIMSGGIRNIYVQHIVMENSHWKTDPLNIAIRLKANMSRGGYIKHVYIRHIDVPNGIRTTPSYFTPIPGGLIPAKSVATSAGAVIVIDCDYDPTGDQVRTRPPVVSDIYVSDVNVGTIETASGAFSSYQAIIILGPVASDYNGPAANRPKILPVSNVSISDCDLGTPVNSKDPIYLFNAENIALKKVRIGSTVYNRVLSVP